MQLPRLKSRLITVIEQKQIKNKVIHVPGDATASPQIAPNHFHGNKKHKRENNQIMWWFVKKKRTNKEQAKNKKVVHLVMH